MGKERVSVDRRGSKRRLSSKVHAITGHSGARTERAVGRRFRDEMAERRAALGHEFTVWFTPEGK